MSRRLLVAVGFAAGAASLAGCVVVPMEPAYGHGYGGPHAVRVAPPVVVVPPPRYRHHQARQRYDWYR